MGCDIHSVGQVRKNGEWETVLLRVAGDDRCYDTFACLANVRNGQGFAGVRTGSGFEPFSDPRGYPKDFITLPESDEHLFPFPNVESECEYADPESQTAWMGDHSHSYITLAELLQYVERVAKNTTLKTGVIPAEQYEEIRGTDQPPKQWSGAVWGGDSLLLSAEAYDQLKEQNALPKDKNIYVQHEWGRSYLETTNLTKILNSLRRIQETYKVEPSDVRMVFGFDS